MHPANEPSLIAGVATAALEVLEAQLPDTDVVIVPIGGGSGACGWLTVRDGLQHSAEVWGVQAAAAPAAHDAWRDGSLVERPNRTRAEGLATGAAFEFTQHILRQSLNDFVLVEDDQIDGAVRSLIEVQHLLVEPAGAASLAAAIQEHNRLHAKRVVLVLSGANITRQQLVTILNVQSEALVVPA